MLDALSDEAQGLAVTRCVAEETPNGALEALRGRSEGFCKICGAQTLLNTRTLVPHRAVLCGDSGYSLTHVLKL